MEKSVFVTVLARIYPALLLAAPGTAVRACTELQHLRNHDPALGKSDTQIHSSAWHRLHSLLTCRLHSLPKQ